MFFETDYDATVGPLMPVKLRNEHSYEEITVNGLLDTGATTSAISTKVVDVLNLSEFTKSPLATAIGTQLRGVYFLTAQLPYDNHHHPFGAFGSSADIGLDLLIGRNILRHGILRITQDSFSFTIHNT